MSQNIDSKTEINHPKLSLIFLRQEVSTFIANFANILMTKSGAIRGVAISPNIFWLKNSAILAHSAILDTFGDMGKNKFFSIK
jgi:hypothetical protein